MRILITPMSEILERDGWANADHAAPPWWPGLPGWAALLHLLPKK